MKRKIPWIDFIFYGSFSLLSLIAVICSIIFYASLPAVIVTSIVSLAFLGIFLVIFFRWNLSDPDYITKHGTAIWIDNIKIIDKDRMEKVLDFYIKNLPKYSHISIASEQIEYMLKNACIEWSTKRISKIGIGWQVKDAAGLQSGKYIKVYWDGSIINSALYHELHHMVDEIVLGKLPDYNHKDKLWWLIIIKLKNEYTRQI